MKFIFVQYAAVASVERLMLHVYMCIDGGGRVHAFIYFINIIEEEEDGATAIRARANTLYAHTLWSFFF